MPREKKDYQACNIKMKENIAIQLDEHCRLTGQTKTAVIEMAVEEYLENFDVLIKKKIKKKKSEDENDG